MPSSHFYVSNIARQWSHVDVYDFGKYSAMGNKAIDP